LSTLKCKSRIKEGERLLSLGRAKEVLIEERHDKHQKSTPEKNNINMSYGIYDKASDAFKCLDRFFIKGEVGSALWSMLREF